MKTPIKKSPIFVKRIVAYTCFVWCSCSAIAQTTEVPSSDVSGLYSRLAAGIMAGDYSNGFAQLSTGYRFGKHVEAGLGFGIQNAGYNRYAPLFLESRWYFGKRNVLPFVGIEGGYLTSLNSTYYYPDKKGGYTFGLNIGVRRDFTKHFGISSSVGYRYTYTNQPYYPYVYYVDYYYYEPTKLEAHRVELRIGIHFQ